VGGGSSTIVAVVDTGVDAAQPDLAGRILPGFDATGGDGSTFDVVGHGTFVAGLISMVDGNGIGGKGIAGATQVLPVRASTDGGFTDSATVSGITWAANHGAGVINLSLGAPGDDPALDRAIDYATAKGALVVASSGNSGDSPSNPVEYPAAYVGGTNGGWSIGLSVGATTPASQPAYFSTHNAYVSIAAPGAGVSSGDCAHGDYSTIPVSTTTTEWDDPSPCNNVFPPDPDPSPAAGRWAYGEGTSFSAPIVSAVAALVRQANPALVPGQVADVLKRSASPAMGPGWNEFIGAGIVNAAGAVALARTYDTTPPTVTFTAVPETGGIQAALNATDTADPGKTVAGGLSFTLEDSRDGSSWGPALPSGVVAVNQLIATTSPVWLRATVCDADHNCVQQVKGPLSALDAAGPKVHPKVKLKLLSHTRKQLEVKIELAKGGKGSAVVELESWTGKKWRAFDRLCVPFGKTRTRTEHVSKKGKYKLRAHLLAGPSFVAAISGSLSLHVK
jgi:subtilisin family serine protease